MEQRSNANLPQQPEYYQTGSTTPPKSHKGLVAALLVLVILLCGIVSILGLMNIHLFRALMDQKEEAAALAFESMPSEAEQELLLADYALDSTQAAFSDDAAIGILGQDISAFYAQFYDVPQGVYVTGIESDCDAYMQGLRTRDIILAYNGTRVTDCSALRRHLSQAAPGERAMLSVYRKGVRFDLMIMLEDVE